MTVYQINTVYKSSPLIVSISVASFIEVLVGGLFPRIRRDYFKYSLIVVSVTLRRYRRLCSDRHSTFGEELVTKIPHNTRTVLNGVLDLNLCPSSYLCLIFEEYLIHRYPEHPENGLRLG